MAAIVIDADAAAERLEAALLRFALKSNDCNSIPRNPNELLQHDPDELSAFAADVVIRGTARLAGPVFDATGTGAVRVEPAAAMSDKEEILAAIAALGTRLETHIEGNHTDLMGKIDVIANGTGRIEADVHELKTTVERD